MRATCLRLWTEQTGAIVSAEIMLVASILVIGMIVGLKSVRDTVITELADVAQALANVDQSYSYSGTQGHHAFTGGGAFHDKLDFCDDESNRGGQKSKCVVICSSATHPLCGGKSEGGGGHGWH